ncbi:MAG TPA: FAD-binding oxidoreductase [Frankiaceae bacterium]|nr:FAD-binding oxidoreductase [Frankiaceae bacterium]
MTYAVWGWGDPADEPRAADLAAGAPYFAEVLGFPVQPPEQPAPLPDLPRPRVELPRALAALGSADGADRARHAFGRSYRDVVRGLRGQVEHPPDLVARPATEADVVDLLDWAAAANVAVVPFGGGTSVVGGVEPATGGSYAGAVSLDLGALDLVVEVDPVSRAARIQAGVLGPALERQLRPHDLTLRFFPQSFERSTLGGWIATRAAGHYATRLTHIDDVVESVRAVTPAGIWESRRLPGSGAGPSPDRLLLGSEGTLGVVTEAWVRLQARPAHRAGASVAFETFEAGAEAVRRIVQAGLTPAGCRLVDGTEARLTGTLADGRAVLVLSFESPAYPVAEELARAVEVARDTGGAVLGDPPGAGSNGGRGAGSNGAGGDAAPDRRDAAGEQWRQTFVRAPYLRDQLVLLGVLTETFETAITWDRMPAFVADVRAATTDALRRVAGDGHVTCRLTHVYPDGAAPYFTVLAPARRGSELAQWAEVKAAASEAIAAAGGTITHHHAVGRDHRPWYDRQRPDPFAAALRAAKHALDPAGVLNPGVLLDPR